MKKLCARVGWLSIFLLAGSPGFLSGQVNPPHSAEVQKYSAQAAQALKANRPDTAEQMYRAILKIDPANADARAKLGVVGMVERNWAGAAGEFRKALKLQPSLWKAQALLGLCELNLGHVPEASKLLSQSFPHLQDVQLRIQAGLQLVEIWYQSGDLEKATSVLNQMQQLDPANVDVLYAAYRVHSDLAFHAIDSLALAGPDSAQLHRALAEHWVNEGHLEDAILEYRKTLQSSSALPGVHYELGEALLGESHLEASLAEAQKEFEAAMAQNPADAKSECMLGKIALWHSNATAAFDHYARALKVNPDVVCAKLGLAGLLIDAGKSTEALKYLESAARSAPFNPEVRHRLAVLYREMGRKEDADRELSAYQELEKAQNQLQKNLQHAPRSE